MYSGSFASILELFCVLLSVTSFESWVGTWQFVKHGDGSFGRIGNFGVIWEYFGYYDQKLEQMGTHDRDIIERMMPHHGVVVFARGAQDSEYARHVPNVGGLGIDAEDVRYSRQIGMGNQRVAAKDKQGVFLNNRDIAPNIGFPTLRFIPHLQTFTDHPSYTPAVVAAIETRLSPGGTGDVDRFIGGDRGLPPPSGLTRLQKKLARLVTSYGPLMTNSALLYKVLQCKRAKLGEETQTTSERWRTEESTHTHTHTRTHTQEGDTARQKRELRSAATAAAAQLLLAYDQTESVAASSSSGPIEYEV